MSQSEQITPARRVIGLMRKHEGDRWEFQFEIEKSVPFEEVEVLPTASMSPQETKSKNACLRHEWTSIEPLIVEHSDETVH